MDYVIRKALESDRYGIAKTVAYSFEKEISALSKDLDRVARAIQNAVETNRFYVSLDGNDIVGVIACADCHGRAFTLSKHDFKKQLGFIRGSLGYAILYPQLTRPHQYHPTTGVIDVVGVLSHARGKGIAKKMLKTVIDNNPQYSEFIIDTTSDNHEALKCYQNFGFSEFKRVAVKFTKRGKVYLRYP